MKKSTKILIGVLAFILIATGIAAICVYFAASAAASLHPDAKPLERLAWTVDDREYYLEGSLYGDFLGGAELIDAETNAVEPGQQAPGHQARTSWSNMDLVWVARVCLYNDGMLPQIDPLCKMCKIELFASFTYNHTITVGGLDMSVAQREDLLRAFGEPDEVEKQQLFAKPNIVVDRLVYYGLEDGESVTFNVNVDNSYIESVILQSRAVDEVEDTAEIRKGVSRFGTEGEQPS